MSNSFTRGKCFHAPETHFMKYIPHTPLDAWLYRNRITGRDLAKQADIAESLISLYRTGKREPPAHHVKAINAAKRALLAAAKFDGMMVKLKEGTKR